jgi:hypothetical protein
VIPLNAPDGQVYGLAGLFVDVTDKALLRPTSMGAVGVRTRCWPVAKPGGAASEVSSNEPETLSSSVIRESACRQKWYARSGHATWAGAPNVERRPTWLRGDVRELEIGLPSVHRAPC